MRILKTLYRRHVDGVQFESTIAFYESLQGMRCERRLGFPEMGIEAAVIGAFIVLAGTDEALAPVRHVEAALIVDALDDFVEPLRALGASVPEDFHRTPVGRNMIVRHPDGFAVEYFEPAA
ncbi:VOC family protein [Trinickia terrae]|uniref:VOC family protein n=1 Tax=Trinickia terrae TaxID=2571161 RepID=A0A4V5PI80_9BURK|nr:VOC family protein [Trinickia terrae]TKC86350.1 VOC family protein [Trinickia terrae]